MLNCQPNILAIEEHTVDSIPVSINNKALINSLNWTL